jgi:tetratricopeptide (TPR) repeat protein
MGLEFEPFFPQPPSLKPSQKWHVFVSYRSDDRRWVLKLHDALRHLKYDVFMDVFVLSAGGALSTSLDEGISKSAAAVIVWSKNYQTSTWTDGEYNALQGRRRAERDFGLAVATTDSTPLEGMLAGDIATDFSDQPDGPCGLSLLRLVLGFARQPLPKGAVEAATEIDSARKRYMAQIKAARTNDDPDRLIELAQSMDAPWRDSPILGSAAAEGLIAAERYDAAAAVLARLRNEFPEAVRPRQLEALSARRRRDWRQAQDILGAMYAEGLRDAETVGMYGGTWWIRYLQSKDKKHLLRSRDLYREAFTLDPKDYYTGINAASKSLFAGEPEVAKEIATQVEALLAEKAGNYYELATLGEARLLEKDYAKARQYYQSAVLTAPGETGNQTPTRDQARAIMDALQTGQADRDQVEQVFAHLSQPAEKV